MISGIDYAKGNDESCTITFVNPEYIKRLEEENKQLKENNQAMQEEMARTWEKLDVIKKIKSWLLERLDDENDIFSVVRVRDVLFRLNKLENKGEENEKKKVIKNLHDLNIPIEQIAKAVELTEKEVEEILKILN